MNRFIQTAALIATFAVATAGCELIEPMSGSWDVEVVDADDCSIELDLDQNGDELEGEADVSCRLFFSIGGESFYYDMEADDADVEGDISGGEFELDITFYDDFFEDEIELTLIGERDGDELEGDVELDGDDFGEFEGER